MTFTYNAATEPKGEHTHTQRRAKIVCTIGPACNTEAMMRNLMRAGMDVARLNFSHGTHADHQAVIQRLRQVAAEEHRSICILQDLQGPKIRTSWLKDHQPVELKAGDTVTITPREIPGDATTLSTTFKTLARDVQPGSRILLSDGKIELSVSAIHGDDVECHIVNGGLLGEHQGINIPGAILSIPALTDKDLDDLRFGIANGVDAVAISFVRTAGDLKIVRRALAEQNANVFVIAKLEKPQAIEHLEEIFNETDGVMVARGDLGVEVPPEKVPVLQKHIIKRAWQRRIPVITATQMLESMIESPRPTRAEASDVANAIFDGTDAVMLSGETAAGKFPREAVAMMARIITEAESHCEPDMRRRREHVGKNTISEAVCDAVSHAGEDLDMRAIAIYTESGNTARILSKHRPRPPIYAFSHLDTVVNRLNLFWGVRSIACPSMRSSREMILQAEELLIGAHQVSPGDIIGVVAGTRSSSGSTNFMRLHVIGTESEEERPPLDTLPPAAKKETP
ncbi:MAG TPA: pyruvate kinase [Candidatus Koribacter sp.]|jgi:pyruvate kinase